MKTRIAVCSSIVMKDGKYGVMIHTGDGKILVEPDCRFDTVDEAMKAGTAILDKGMELLNEEGYKAYRPARDETP